MKVGDVLKVVVRIDRLARSVSQLLNVIEILQGAYFRSLRDPIDTTTPQGMFSLQVQGAVAQLLNKSAAAPIIQTPIVG